MASVKAKQDSDNFGVLCLVMSYIACKITCDPMFYRSVEFHLPYVVYPIKIATSVFLYPLTFILCDWISTLLSGRQTFWVILFGAVCDGFFSYTMNLLSFFAIPHAMQPAELQLVKALDLLGHPMWVLFYRGVIASLVTTIAEVVLFSILFKRIKNINLSMICSVTTVLIVHNLVLNYPLRRHEAGGVVMVINGLLFELIFLLIYVFGLATFKKIWNNKALLGSTSYIATNILTFVEKLTFKNRHAKLMNENFKNIAHDIQSPILLLASVVDVLEDEEMFRNHIGDLKDSLGTLQMFASEMIENVRKEIKNVTNDILYENKLEYVRVGKLINNEIAVKNIEYKKEFALKFKDYNPDKPHIILTNPTRFNRILSNLINNARDALLDSTDPKEILIELFEAEEIVIVISNFGKIIAPELLNQVLIGLSTKHGGKGIGLSSAVTYLKTINSRLSITSSALEGTKVTITLPIQSSQYGFNNGN